MALPGPVELAVSNFVDAGLYPQDEDIITAELPSATLKSLGSLLDRARSDVKTSIRELSRLSAPDVDGWITQAKQLKRDIDGSVKQSDKISELGEENTALQQETTEAAGKVNFLKSEVTFNQTLVDTLSSIRKGKDTLEDAAKALADNDIPQAVSGLSAAQQQLSSLGTFQTTTVASILGENIADLERKLQESLEAHWQRLVAIDAKSTTVRIVDTSSKPSLQVVADALASLDLLMPKVAALWKAIDTLLLGPRLARQDGRSLGFAVDGASITLSSNNDRSIRSLFADIEGLRAFLKSNFPANVEGELSAIMMPSLLTRLTFGPLPASVPADLGGVPSFAEDLRQVSTFAQTLERSGWQETSELKRWVQNAPEIWLHGRMADSLNSMRQLLKRGLGNPRSVERVETQTVVATDELFGGAGGAEDDWDAAWNEDQEDQAAARPQAQHTSEHDATGTDEEQNAWGWDDDTGEQGEASGDQPLENDDGEAWGWGDGDGEEDQPGSPVKTRTAAPEPTPRSLQPVATNGSRVPAERTVTLRESYFITAIPESVLELIIMVVEDADNLSRTISSPVSPAAQGLYSLAALLLAMYRASAPDAYSIHESGNMFVYNDSQYLAEQLRLFADHHASRGSAAQPSLTLQADISTLEGYGKRAYSREMESQKTILRDQLDDAQGFVNCTQQPQAGQCELAVSQVIDRIRSVNSQWKHVLSPSALLQSTGSLLSTVVNKIILDILDMSDIQESESQALTRYCSSFESLEDLFLPPQQQEHAKGEGPIPLTAGYVPNWLRFQYLSNILDSSLVDIKYLWTEGSLSLEFKPEEVVDLIEALFADSPRRKEAINEIRRSTR